MVPVFRLHMMQDLWKRTSEYPGFYAGVPVREPKSVTEDPNTGMATVELTGSQMVDYLKVLDYRAHGGGLGESSSSLAMAVYDSIAPVLDSIQTPPAPGAPAPEIVISAATGPAASTPALAPTEEK